MEYVTGKHALNLECKLETCGDWHTSALKWEKVDINESDNSVFGMYGIEDKILLPNGIIMAHANHIRAILDIMERGNKYELMWLNGFKKDFICTDIYDEEIFKLVLKLKGSSEWDSINTLMSKEYKMKWIEYFRRNFNGRLES